MSKEVTGCPILGWSASKVTLFDPQSRQYHSGANVAEVAAHIGSHSVVVALSRRSSFIRTVRVPDAPKEQVEQILRLQLPGLLPISAQDLAFDFRVTANASEEGKLAVVAAVAGETLRLIHRDLKAAGIRVSKVVPEAFGSWMLAQSLGLDQCAVAERVSEGLAIDIIADGDLRYTRIAPYPKTADGVEEEVCRTFTVAKVPCSHIVAAAGLSFETANTTVATRPLELFASPWIQKLDLNIELPEVLVSRAKNELNSKARQAIALWFAVLAVGSVVSFLRTSDAKKVAQADAPYNHTSSQLGAKLKMLKSSLATEQGLQTALLSSFHPAQSMTDVIASFGQQVPSSKMWIGGFTLERGKPLMIRGTALDSDSVATFVQSLDINPRFANVKLVFDNNGTIQSKPVQEFSVQAHVIGNFPLPGTAEPGGAKSS